MKHNYHLILASSSSSRKMILDKLSVPYDMIAPDIDETFGENESVENYVLRLSQEKALKVASLLPSACSSALVIGCDSVCVLDGKVMSKPETHDNAIKQLQLSSGQCVNFYSGLTLYNTKTHNRQQDIVETHVYFKSLSIELIEAYLQKDKPYDCAGSLRAEGLGIVLVEKMVSTDPNSLIGLPLISLITMLEKECYYFL